jgi:hypothetical protein
MSKSEGKVGKDVRGHTMKACRGSRSMIPPTLGDEWRLRVNITGRFIIGKEYPVPVDMNGTQAGKGKVLPLQA